MALTIPDRRERVQRAMADQAAAERAEQPSVVNLAPVIELTSGALFGFRERMYHAPPISFEDGARLTELYMRIVALAKQATDVDAGAQMRGIAEVQREATRMFRRLCHPIDWRRFVWPVCPNPFRSASSREVDDLLGFFWELQTTSSVRYRSQKVRADRKTS